MADGTCISCNSKFPEEVLELFIQSETNIFGLMCMGCIIKRIREVIGDEYQFETKYAQDKYLAYLNYMKKGKNKNACIKKTA
jgi:hypothetical protein